MRSSPAKNVDDYLSRVSEEARRSLEKIRAAIRSTVPDAEEIISYQIPMYKYQGPLVGFAAFTDHCSFFVMSPKVMEAHKEDLARYQTSKVTIRFPIGKPIPGSLVKKLVKAQIAENEKVVRARREKQLARRRAKGKSKKGENRS